jgi:hypothetical protein
MEPVGTTERRATDVRELDNKLAMFVMATVMWSAHVVTARARNRRLRIASIRVAILIA